MFGDGLFGSPFKLGFGLTAGRSRTSATITIRRSASGLSLRGASRIRVSQLVRRFGAGTSLGHSRVITGVIRRRPVAATTRGKSTSHATSVRKRGYLLLRPRGVGLTRVSARRRLRSITWRGYGKSLSHASLIKLVLPPPVRTMRIAPWTRPAQNVDLRVQKWFSQA
jgi:hypothetical protein